MSLLTDSLEKINIDYNDEMIRQVDLFYDLIVEKNKVMNLTAITEKKDFIQKHIIDSLLSFVHYDFSDQKIIDVGTGAGFPGLPLKIFFPNLDMTMIDSVNKKLNFINEVIDELGLKNIRTVHGRAEDLGQNNIYREKFDVGVSRAVANMSSLSELCLPFIRIGGKFIFYKSYDSEEEIRYAENALNILGKNLIQIYDVNIPETDIIRKLVITEKQSSIQKKYPRKAGEPNRHPL